MTTLKLRPVGSSTGVIFPKELLAKLDVKAGDELFVVESPEGLLLTPFDPEVARDVELGAGFMRKYRSTFRELAK